MRFEGHDSTMNPEIDRILQFKRIRVACPFNCGFTGAINEVHYHEDEVCPQRPVHCPFPQCQMTVKGGQLANHIRFCSKRTFNCPNCSLPVRDTTFADHNCIMALTRALNNQQEAIRNQETELLRWEWTMGVPGEPVCVDQSSYDEESPTFEYCARFEQNPPALIVLSEGASSRNLNALEEARKPNNLAIFRRKRKQNGQLTSTSHWSVQQYQPQAPHVRLENLDTHSIFGATRRQPINQAVQRSGPAVRRRRIGNEAGAALLAQVTSGGGVGPQPIPRPIPLQRQASVDPDEFQRQMNTSLDVFEAVIRGTHVPPHTASEPNGLPVTQSSATPVTEDQHQSHHTPTGNEEQEQEQDNTSTEATHGSESDDSQDDHPVIADTSASGTQKAHPVVSAIRSIFTARGRRLHIHVMDTSPPDANNE